jgi:hypothetical protein
VSFSGGGGSGAAAYATVGSGSIIKSLGASTISAVGTASFVFQTPNTVAPAFIIREAAGADSFVMLNPQSAYTNLVALGNANANFGLYSNGTGYIALGTAGTTNTVQMRVSHTASAVNYVQVTGGVTGNPATVTASAQGSDSNVNMRLTPKGTGTLLTATAATILDGTAIPAGGTAGAGYKLSSTANFGIFFGSGAPTLAAAKGSLYMRSDGSSIATRMYINTDGSTTWTNVVTAA